MDALERRHWAALSPSKLLARVMGDRGEDVLAYLLVVQIGVTALQRTQCPNPGVGVDVLDLVIRERTTERPPHHRPRRAAKLLVQARRSIPPRQRLLRWGRGGAGSSDRRHTRLPTIRTPPSRHAPPVTTSPPLFTWIERIDASTRGRPVRRSKDANSENSGSDAAARRHQPPRSTRSTSTFRTRIALTRVGHGARVADACTG